MDRPYGIEIGESTPGDEDEQAELLPALRAWKSYKFALGKVTGQAVWPAAPTWPAEPAAPDISASPQLNAVDLT
ncbi:hypothetical protein [Pseudomonas purpurea]|uniref:hypothetical protein n=1 Tax=Pseudomonas purpurea TaxID=3136737 RepID=UPI003267BF5B